MLSFLSNEMISVRITFYVTRKLQRQYKQGKKMFSFNNAILMEWNNRVCSSTFHSHYIVLSLARQIFTENVHQI